MMEHDDDHIAAIVRTVLTVPLHRALGLRLADPDDPTIGVEIDVGEMAVNNMGVLHGGLVPLLLDVSSYLAAIPHLGPDTNAVTHSASASLARGVPLGATVRFTGRVDRAGRSLVFCSALALHEDRVVATGQVVKSVVPLAHLTSSPPAPPPSRA